MVVSSEADASICLSEGENAREVTPSSCPRRVDFGIKEGRFQILIVLSWDPEAS